MPNRPDSHQNRQHPDTGYAGGFFLFALAGRSRALVLLLALVGQILLTSLGANQRILPSVYQALVVLAAIVVAADTHRHLRSGLALGMPALALTLGGYFVQNDVLSWLTYGVVLLLYVYIVQLMLAKIFKASTVTLDTIGYALCTYMLLGLIWTLFYAPVAALDPAAFSQPIIQEGNSPGATLIYFSFVTLTTLGYGDISPLSEVTRSLAILEALTGTLFLAVLISRLIGAYSSAKR